MRKCQKGNKISHTNKKNKVKMGRHYVIKEGFTSVVEETM